MIYLLEDTTNQPSKFRTKTWVEINDEKRGTYNANSDIRFKTSMIRPKSYDNSDAYTNVKATITVPNTAAAAAVPADNTKKKVIFKNCAPFAKCIIEINNSQVDDAQDIQVVMPMYNLIEYSNVYSKTLRSLWIINNR